LKIAYLSGPANTREIYREWAGNERQAYVGTDYMKQFLQLATDVGAKSYVVSWYGDRRETVQVGDFIFDNRPITSAGGARYYIEMIVWHMKVLAKLIAFRPDVLLLTGNQSFWWLLSPMRLWRAKIITSHHAVMWMKFIPPNWIWRLMVKLNGALILKRATAIVVTSNDIRRQVEEVLRGHVQGADIVNHLPTYSPAQFRGIASAPEPSQRPFRVLFLGRMVRNKGIFDIVEMARQLERDAPGMYRFDLCGEGDDLAQLRRGIAEYHLDAVVRTHGFCGQDQVRPLLNQAHIFIVPTRTDCEAGFEMTCAESILSGRPLVSSSVCPALEYLADAAVEAKPDDPESYCEAILELSNDPQLFQRKRAACAGLQAQFYDPRNSWIAAMKDVLTRHALAPASTKPAEFDQPQGAEIHG
jgi:glycosyltransferase involved in cell wall biosynthesis